MSQRAFSLTAAVIFLLIALAHALRIVFRLQATLDGRTLPMWVSWVAFVAVVYLASEGFRLARKG